jgi:hypothetical protein
MQACSVYLGSPLYVFYMVGATAFTAALPFLFVASPKPPAADNDEDSDAEGSQDGATGGSGSRCGPATGCVV